jgi:hypothetical protein
MGVTELEDSEKDQRKRGRRGEEKRRRGRWWQLLLSCEGRREKGEIDA